MKLLLLWIAFLGPLQGVDDAVRQAVQGVRTPAVDPVMHFATDVGKPVTVMALLLGLAVLGGPNGVETARLALLTAAPTNLVVEVVKRASNRARPDGERKRSNASFPSSHAANAFALAAVFARRRRRWAPLFWGLAALVAFSRVWLDRHFLTDVLAAALIGILCEWGVARLTGKARAGRS